jgi:transglutaminase superfamily protein
MSGLFPRRIVRAICSGRLSGADCRLLACACVAETLAYAILPFASIATSRRLLGRFGRALRAIRGSASAERVLRALEASACWPASTCLTRALSGELLLDDRSALMLCIGIGRAEDGRFLSHAWLERHSLVLVGAGGSQDRCVALVSWTTGAA